MYRNGIVKIPAGTPLAMYMLVKKDKIEANVRSVTNLKVSI